MVVKWPTPISTDLRQGLELCWPFGRTQALVGFVSQASKWRPDRGFEGKALEPMAHKAWIIALQWAYRSDSTCQRSATRLEDGKQFENCQSDALFDCLTGFQLEPEPLRIMNSLFHTRLDGRKRNRGLVWWELNRWTNSRCFLDPHNLPADGRFDNNQQAAAAVLVWQETTIKTMRFKWHVQHKDANAGQTSSFARSWTVPGFWGSVEWVRTWAGGFGMGRVSSSAQPFFETWRKNHTAQDWADIFLFPAVHI